MGGVGQAMGQLYSIPQLAQPSAQQHMASIYKELGAQLVHRQRCEGAGWGDPRRNYACMK